MPSPFDPNLLFTKIRSKGVSEWQDTINKMLRNAILDLMAKSNGIITESKTFKRVSFTGTQDGLNTLFTLSNEIEIGSDQVFLGSFFLYNESNGDYTISEIAVGGLKTKLEFTTAPFFTDKITIFGNY